MRGHLLLEAGYYYGKYDIFLRNIYHVIVNSFLGPQTSLGTSRFHVYEVFLFPKCPFALVAQVPSRFKGS